MPQINASPLTERLQNRLAHNLPASLSGRDALSSRLGSVLQEIANASFEPHTHIPADGMGELGESETLHALHTALQLPVEGEAAELSAVERQTVRFVAHLRDICAGGDHLVTSNIALALAHHESAHVSRNLVNEVLRELGTLPVPYVVTPGDRRQATAAAIVEKLILTCKEKGLVPSHAQLFAVRELAPANPGHPARIAFRIAAWNDKAPPPMVPVTPPPGVEPATYATHAPDLSQAPCQISWVI